MNRRILFLTKDAFCKEYLPAYGNKPWNGKTPNLDELARKGTVFNRVYTSAPSTVMSFRSMMTQTFPYEQPYKSYNPEDNFTESVFFAEAEKRGYKGHIIWDEAWIRMVLRFGNCYGKQTTIHNLPNLRQGVGVHYNRKEPLVTDPAKTELAISELISEVESICNSGDDVVVWIHLPHVINGRTGYGSDLDVFDQIVGKLRNYFDDENIFISADHGNMNGYQGKFTYGFDLHTSAIEIPLITPRMADMKENNDYLTSVDIWELIFNRKIVKRDHIFVDTAYYAQPHRKLAIIKNGIKYIYKKNSQKEYLYDIENDRAERCNLLNTVVLDVDRKMSTPLSEVYYSPYFDDVDKLLSDFRSIKKEIWRDAPKKEEIKFKLINKTKGFLHHVVKLFGLKPIVDRITNHEA